MVEEDLLRKEFGAAAKIRCRSRLNLSRNGVRDEARSDDKSKPRASAPASATLHPAQTGPSLALLFWALMLCEGGGHFVSGRSPLSGR